MIHKIGVPIPKQKLCDDFPPYEYHDIQFRKALSIPIFQSELQFCVVNFEILKFGAE